MRKEPIGVVRERRRVGVSEELRQGKKAMAMVSDLDGLTFEYNARMSEEHQKYPAVVAEVVNSSLSTQRDRDTAIHDLTEQSWRAGECPASLAHGVCRLAKLAYPGLTRMRSIP